MLLGSLRLFFPSRKGRKMAHWQQFAHKPQTKNLNFGNEDERANTSMSAKGIMLFNLPESNCTNNYLALSKAFATMTHQVAHRVTHGLSAKWETSNRLTWHHVALCFLSEIKEQKFFRGAHTAQQPRCTHWTTSKVHTLHVNCLKVQSGRAARKKRTKTTSVQRENTFKREKDVKYF